LTQQEFEPIMQDVLKLLRTRGFEHVKVSYIGMGEQARLDIVECAPAALHKKLRQRMVNSLAKLRASARSYVVAKLGVTNSDIWQGPRDSDGEPCRWINHYHCERMLCHLEGQLELYMQR